MLLLVASMLGIQVLSLVGFLWMSRCSVMRAEMPGPADWLERVVPARQEAAQQD